MQSASDCLAKNGNGNPHVWGIDIDGEALAAVDERVPHCKLINANFFSIKPSETPRFDAVVGNRPIILYQSIKGAFH